MQTKTLIGVALLIVVLGGLFYFTNNKAEWTVVAPAPTGNP